MAAAVLAVREGLRVTDSPGQESTPAGRVRLGGRDLGINPFGPHGVGEVPREFAMTSAHDEELLADVDPGTACQAAATVRKAPHRLLVRLPHDGAVA